MESWSAFPESRAGEGLICVTEVRITTIQGLSTPGCAIDMLIKFRESCFQISLVKIPSYNECSLNKVRSEPSMCLLGGEYIRL